MDEIEWIKALDSGRGDVPHVDVAHRVMLAVVAQQHETDAVFPFAAILSTVAGVAAIWIALPVWFSTQDPLAGLADAFQMVLQ